MKDASYNSGVTTESVIKMVYDIGEVYKGNTIYIAVPNPTDKIGPASHISFGGDLDPCVEALNIPSSGNGSRRFSAYSFNNKIVSGGPLNITTGPSSTVNMKIEDALRLYKPSLPDKDNDLDDVVEEDDDTKSTAAEPVVTGRRRGGRVPIAI